MRWVVVPTVMLAATRTVRVRGLFGLPLSTLASLVGRVVVPTVMLATAGAIRVRGLFGLACGALTSLVRRVSDPSG